MRTTTFAISMTDSQYRASVEIPATDPEFYLFCLVCGGTWAQRVAQFYAPWCRSAASPHGLVPSAVTQKVARSPGSDGPAPLGRRKSFCEGATICWSGVGAMRGVASRPRRTRAVGARLIDWPGVGAS